MLLTAVYEDGISILYTKAIFQYEKNVTLRIDNLPISFPITLDIGNNNEIGNSVRYSTYNTPFQIPDDFFMSGENVYIWVKAAWSTVLVVIPVKSRPAPVSAPQGSGGDDDSGYEYDEEDENLILNGGLNDIINGNVDDDEDEEEDE